MRKACFRSPKNCSSQEVHCHATPFRRVKGAEQISVLCSAGMAPSPAPYVSPVHREVQETGPPQSYALFLGTAERLHATREVPDQRDQHAPPVTNFIAPDKHFPCLIFSKNSNLDCLSVVRQYVDHVDLALMIASLRKSRNNRYVVNFEDHTSLIKLSCEFSHTAQRTGGY